MAKAALQNMGVPQKGRPDSGICENDISNLAKMALGNMNGVSSKFIPSLPEDEHSIEELTERAVHAMPTDSDWINDAMSGDKMKISELAKKALTKQFPPVSGGIQDNMNQADQKEAEEVAIKEVERIQNEEIADQTKNNIEAEIGSSKDQLKEEVKKDQEILKKTEEKAIEKLEMPKKKEFKIDDRSAMEKAYESA